ncbi:MAG: biopolymer transporter ExbD [Spartobacteria bacterium]|nr:biopolymer transporter ExbD [Spartobacteria bacterium]
MKLKRQNTPDVDVDMTPMIDMVFLLLVFFMCAATMSQVDFTPEIKLPVAPKADVPEDLRNRGTINILPVGYVLAGGEVVSEDQPYMVSGELMGKARLTEVIADHATQEPEMRVYMRIDRNVDFSIVQTAIKACAQAGVFDIIFASYQSRGGD